MKNSFKIITLGEENSQLVRDVQNGLNRACEHQTRVDGLFGENTRNQVRLFQSNHRDARGRPLKIDSIVGPLTWQSLFDGQTAGERTIPPLLAEVIRVARMEIGVKEDPPYSNRGRRVEEYLKSVGLGPSYPWCAGFAFYCYKSAAFNLGMVNPVYPTASCLQHWQKTSGEKITAAEAIKYPSLIEAGFIFITKRGAGRGHTGIVTGVHDGLIQTIEGNASAFSSNAGDGVYALERRIESITIGYIKYA